MDEALALAPPAAVASRPRLRRSGIPGVARSAALWLGRDAAGDRGDPARPARPGGGPRGGKLRRADPLRLARPALCRASLGVSQGGAGVLRRALDRPHPRACPARQWRLDAEAIGKVILFCAATVTIGEVALAAIVLLVAPHPAASWLRVDDSVVRLVGIACAVAIAAYLAAAKWLRRPLKLRRWRIALPTLPIAATQVAAGALGVTEFVVLSFLPSAETWAALIVFRIIYYIVPLALGGIVLGVSELFERRAAPLHSAAAANGRR